jgi:hypothetical protein
MKRSPLNRYRFLTLLAFATLAWAALGFASDGQVTRLAEPVAVSATHEVFGAELPDAATPLSLGELLEHADQYQDQQVLLETRIAKVCQKKGCFFVATEGAAVARVSFKNYGFFIPTDAGGKDVLLLGTISRKDVSREEAEHYAQDLGETGQGETGAASTARFEYSIVATAVKIPRS